MKLMNLNNLYQYKSMMFYTPKYEKELLHRKALSILNNLGIEYAVTNEESIRCRCPFHPGDNHTAFVLYLDNGTFKCWSHNCDEKVGKNFIHAILNHVFVFGNDIAIKSVSTPKTHRPSYIDINDFDPFPEYQKQRGIYINKVLCYKTDKTKYKLQNRAIFFLKDYHNHKILGMTGRSLDGKMPKWKHVLTKKASQLLYYPHIIPYETISGTSTRICLLAEGPIDAIKLEIAAQIPAISILSSSVTYKKAEELSLHFDECIVIADNDIDNKDNPGLNGAKKTCKILREYGIKAKYAVVPILNNKSTDAGDFSIKDLRTWVMKLI